MIISNISRLELLRLCETPFGERVLLCFDSYHSVGWEFKNFVDFLKDNQYEYTAHQRTGKIKFKESEILFRVVQDSDVKEKLAAISISCVVLKDSVLLNENLLWLQHRCRLSVNR